MHNHASTLPRGAAPLLARLAILLWLASGPLTLSAQILTYTVGVDVNCPSGLSE